MYEMLSSETQGAHSFNSWANTSKLLGFTAFSAKILTNEFVFNKFKQLYILYTILLA